MRIEDPAPLPVATCLGGRRRNRWDVLRTSAQVQRGGRRLAAHLRADGLGDRIQRGVSSRPGYRGQQRHPSPRDSRRRGHSRRGCATRTIPPHAEGPGGSRTQRASGILPYRRGVLARRNRAHALERVRRGRAGGSHPRPSRKSKRPSGTSPAPSRCSSGSPRWIPCAVPTRATSRIRGNSSPSSKRRSLERHIEGLSLRHASVCATRAADAPGDAACAPVANHRGLATPVAPPRPA